MTEPEVSFNERLTRRSHRRIALLLGAALAVIVGAAVTMGASPSASPAGPGAPGATSKPEASGDPDKPGGGPWAGIGRFFGGKDEFGLKGFGGEFGVGGVSITAIDGSTLSLTTDDGWSRTIAVTSTTTITKGGKTVAIGDLAVGDKIRFGQTRNADGSYTVTAIQVVLPSVVGTVTGKTANTITIKQPDGTSVTIHVGAGTTYQVAGVTAAGLSHVAVGMGLVAVGTLNTDGSLDATAVHAGNGFRGGPGMHDNDGKPGPSESPGSPSSTG